MKKNKITQNARRAYNDFKEELAKDVVPAVKDSTKRAAKKVKKELDDRF